MIGPLFSWLKRNRADAASGREAGRREVQAIEALRETVFVDREQAALHAQLARAPRDAGALFGLLQWHARRGERDEVEALAHVLWDETDAEGGLWKRAAALGREIDPDNPLYGEDPFKTLNEQAVTNAISLGDSMASLRLDTLDLDFPENADRDAGETKEATLVPHGAGGVAAGSVSGVESVDKALENRGLNCDLNRGLDGGGAASGKDWLSVQTGQLPSSILALDLDLDLDGKAGVQDPSALFALFKQPSRPANALTEICPGRSGDVASPAESSNTDTHDGGAEDASGQMGSAADRTSDGNLNADPRLKGAAGSTPRLVYRPLRGPARKRRNRKPTGK